jgi:hypothetical protein
MNQSTQVRLYLDQEEGEKNRTYSEYSSGLEEEVEF